MAPQAPVLSTLLPFFVGTAAVVAGSPAIVLADVGLGVINGAGCGPDSVPGDVDDALAMAVALAPESGLDVLGVVSTFGNVLEPAARDSARMTLAALGRGSVRVFRGAGGPLAADPVFFAHNWSAPGWVQSAPRPYCENPGTRFIKQQLDTRPVGSVLILALGPLTDVACLARWYPRSLARAREIVALAGSRSGKGSMELYGTDMSDFNFAIDPTAMAVLLSTPGVPDLAFLTFEVTHKGILTVDVLQEWTGQTSSQPRAFIAQASLPHAQWWAEAFPGTKGQMLWDVHVIQYAKNPSLYACTLEKAHVWIGGPPDWTRFDHNCFAIGTECALSTESGQSTSNVPRRVASGWVTACSGYAPPNETGDQELIQAVAAALTPEGSEGSSTCPS